MCRHAGNGAFVFLSVEIYHSQTQQYCSDRAVFLGRSAFAGMGVTYCFIWPNETTITVSENAIEIDGPDAMTIPMSEIRSFKVVKALPETENDSCRIVTESSKSPYVEVQTANKTYYLNKYSSEETLTFFLRLKSVLKTNS